MPTEPNDEPPTEGDWVVDGPGRRSLPIVAGALALLALGLALSREIWGW